MKQIAISNQNLRYSIKLYKKVWIILGDNQKSCKKIAFEGEIGHLHYRTNIDWREKNV